jgi:hypothetical protein
VEFFYQQKNMLRKMISLNVRKQWMLTKQIQIDENLNFTQADHIRALAWIRPHQK